MSEEAVIALAIIEDNRLVREGMTALLDETADFRVVAAGGSPDKVLLQGVEPDVVLLDLGLRNGDSLRMAERVRKELPEARVIVMDLLPAHEEFAAYVNAGVSGFITKDATLEDLAETIRGVAGGATVPPPETTGSLYSQIVRHAAANGRSLARESVRMTPRERQVFALIAEGMSHEQVARQLDVTTHAVKGHVRNIMEKLTLYTRLQVAAHAHAEAKP